MEPTKCISSHIMSSVLAWRNPLGKEENWLTHSVHMQRYNVGNVWEFGARIISTEAALLLLGITSALETTMYATFALASLLLYCCTHKPYDFFAQLLASSSFTIIWAIADAIIYNPFFLNVITRESFARFWADQVISTPVTRLRLQDRAYMSDWVQENNITISQNDLLAPIVQIGVQTNQSID